MIRTRSLPCFALAFSALLAPLPAQDANPVNASALLQELKQIREKQTTQSRQVRQSGLQTILSGAQSGERGAALWEEAVRAVQFEGEAKEGARFRDWKDREGEGLNSKEARNALRLYFTWLALTMQRDAGATVKDLLPQIVTYAKDVLAQQAMVDDLEEQIKRDKELNAGGKHGMVRKGNDDVVRRMCETILNKGLGGSVVVQWLKIGDFVNPEQWEQTPNHATGILNNIVLPELRLEKDPRLLEFWDMRLRQEGDAASKTKRTFDVDRFNNEVRPGLLWSRAEDLLLLGQKNRAVGEMFALVKGFPAHPDSAQWITRLEELLKPPAPPAATAVAPPAPVAPAPVAQ